MEKLNLDQNDLQEVLKWVDSFVLSRPSKKLSRDFSDAVLLAELLKQEFPNYVDLHNYAGCYSIQTKIKNWDTLNQKVLKKLQINLKHDEMEKLSKAENYYIEKLLLTVMRKIKQIKETKQKELEENENALEIVTITNQVGDHIEISRTVPYETYETLKEECESLKSYANNLREEIKELHNELESKTNIIKNLEDRLEESRKKRSLSLRSIKKSFSKMF